MTMLTRRDSLRLAALTGAGIALPAKAAAAVRPSSPRSARDAADGGPFALPLPIPDVLEPVARTRDYDLYRMRMCYADLTVIPGLTTRLQTFNGQFPGPTIRARRGRPVVVEQYNDLAVETAVHLHGGHVSHDSDGYPLEVLRHGDRRRYFYPNDQPAATLWYHDHAHMVEAQNVYRGLAGTYLLTDDYEEDLPLPRGRYDIPLMLRDAKIEVDGSLTYDGYPFHPTILVNGRSQPHLDVAARRYRFRILNGANSRVFNLSLGNGDEVVQIGSDGGLLPAPAPSTALALFPAERADVVIDFSRYPVGSQVLLHNTLNFLPGEPTEILRFDVVREAQDRSRVPQRLRPVDDLGVPVVERDFALTFDPMTLTMLINGKTFDPNRVDIRPELGVPESWTISNPDTRLPVPHTFHVHHTQFRVIERDGKPPAPGESGLKDTIALNPGETVRILLRFTEFTGLYVYHCHMIEHAEMGMMGQMNIERR